MMRADPRCYDAIGLELELEGHDHEDMPESPWWGPTRDGSLRNGTEWVLNAPMNAEHRVQVWNEAEDTIFDKEWQDSIRCSTHIHVDVRKYSASLVQALMLVAYANEVRLFQHDPDRITNIYCPLAINKGNLSLMLTRAWAGRQAHTPKWSAINTETMLRHGSVEFRAFGAATSLEKLQEYMRIVDDIVKVAHTFKVGVHRLRAVLRSDDYSSLLISAKLPYELAQLEQQQHAYMRALFNSI